MTQQPCITLVMVLSSIDIVIGLHCRFEEALGGVLPVPIDPTHAHEHCLKVDVFLPFRNKKMFKKLRLFLKKKFCQGDKKNFLSGGIRSALLS